MWSWGACDGEPAAFVFALARQTLMLPCIACARCALLLFGLLCFAKPVLFFLCRESKASVCKLYDEFASMTDEWSVSSTPHQVKQKIWRKKSVL